MSNTHILVMTDTVEAADHLVKHLLPEVGYEATQADSFTPAPPVDIVLVDVAHLRGNPLGSLEIQRNMGCTAPAILCAPRLTGEMAAELFPLDIRGFIRKPIADADLLSELDTIIQNIGLRQNQDALQRDLQETQAALSRRLEEMNALSRVGRSITSLRDTNTILSRILEASVFLTRADTAAIFLFDHETNNLVLRAHHGMDTNHLRAAQLPSMDSDAQLVFQTGKPIMRSGGEQAKITTGYLPRASISTPIITGKTITGVLAVHRDASSAHFAEADQVITSSLADFTAIALNKAAYADSADAQIESALAAARSVQLHVETLQSPIDGIESQVETLLAGGFDPLNEAQRTAVTRIKQATERMKEIAEFINDELADFEQNSPVE